MRTSTFRKRAVLWLGGVVITLAVSQFVSAGTTRFWAWINFYVDPWASASISIVVLGAISLAGAAWGGLIPLPMDRIVIHVQYILRILPVLSNEIWSRVRRRSPYTSGFYESEAAFSEENPNRTGPTQIDFGVHWRDPARTGCCRVTWIEKTGELVAVWGGRDGEGPVELLGIITGEHGAERRLEGHDYVCIFSHSLKWVRRRAVGLAAPLPPRAEMWRRRDLEPEPLPPTPPQPTIGKKFGAYVGTRSDGDATVRIMDEQGLRPLYHFVERSPTGLEWGYGGAGPGDLARSILADRLGYVPNQVTVHSFAAEVVYELDRDGFLLSFSEVDAWILENGELFADDPFADPTGFNFARASSTSVETASTTRM